MLTFASDICFLCCSHYVLVFLVIAAKFLQFQTFFDANKHGYVFAVYCHLENTVFHINCDTGKGARRDFCLKIFYLLPHQSDVGKPPDAMKAIFITFCNAR